MNHIASLPKLSAISMTRRNAYIDRDIGYMSLDVERAFDYCATPVT